MKTKIIFAGLLGLAVMLLVIALASPQGAGGLAIAGAMGTIFAAFVIFAVIYGIVGSLNEPTKSNIYIGCSVAVVFVSSFGAAVQNLRNSSSLNASLDENITIMVIIGFIWFLLYTAIQFEKIDKRPYKIYNWFAMSSAFWFGQKVISEPLFIAMRYSFREGIAVFIFSAIPAFTVFIAYYISYYKNTSRG